MALASWSLWPDSAARLKIRAESAAKVGDWEAARTAWGRAARADPRDAVAAVGEARALLAIGKAGQAETALARAVALAPGDPLPWRLRLELLRLEDRQAEARRVGREAMAAVDPAGRRDLLRSLTLALLADPPDELAREALGRFVAADPTDVDARVALARRGAGAGTADRLVAGAVGDATARVGALAAIFDGAPGHVGAREALIAALADAGEVERGRALLDSWPIAGRDARYDRLAGRWALEYDRRPAEAVDSLRRALDELPHDWRSRYRLARALRAIGRDAEARAEANRVARHRERLDPRRLGPALDAALDRPDDPAPARALAELCEAVGLADLALAWRAEAAALDSPPRGANNGLGSGAGGAARSRALPIGGERSR